MSVQIGVRISKAGIDAKIAKLRAADAIVEKYADMAVNLAKKYVRVDTGTLQSTIKKDTKQTLNSFVIRISAGEGLKDGRATANEYGTSVMAAQPYIRPALEQIRGPFLAELRELMR